MNCQLCNRDTPKVFIEKHHFYPRSKRKSEDKHKDKSVVDGILVCCNCGDQIHQLFTNQELAKEYNTLEKLLANESLQKWIKWIKNKPNDFSVCMKRKK